MVLPSLYLPPVSWFSAVKSVETCGFSGGVQDVVSVEAYENYHKQTCRNRCYIDSPSGRIALSIPIDRSNFSDKGKCLMRDIRISSQFDWRRQHWHALETAYYSSPFFEYLQDDFRPIYDKPWVYLIDLNDALIAKCLELLEIDVRVKRTTDYEGITELPPAKPLKYYQVFAKHHGFIEDLSVVDLLFNMGNEAVMYL